MSKIFNIETLDLCQSDNVAIFSHSWIECLQQCKACPRPESRDTEFMSHSSGEVENIYSALKYVYVFCLFYQSE